MEEEDFLTKDFGSKVLQQMYTFYLEEQFCDFQIKVEGKVYKVHRLVLTSNSDFFRAMLSHDMQETREECTDLQGVTIQGMEPLIKYMYTGKMPLSLTNVKEVVSAATYLQIGLAVELCIQFLKEKMTFDNAEDVLHVGDTFSIPSLKEYYRNYILKNFLHFVESSRFLNIDAESLIDYLSDDALVTTSESILFHHCLRWYNHDPENRSDIVDKVFEKIRFVIDGWPLIMFARTQEPFISNPKCNDLIQFCEDYMSNPSCKYLQNDHRTRVRYTRKTLVQISGLMQTDPSYDFEDYMSLPDDELIGTAQNYHFHPDLKAWFGLGGNVGVSDRRSHCTVVEVNDFAILIGGYEYFVDEDDHVLRTCIRDVRLFSAQGSFSLWNMKGLQHARAQHAAVFVKGCVYVIGGKDDRQSLSSMEKLTCDTETWSYVKQLPRALYDHAATVVKNQIFVSGGVERFDVKNNVWCYDPVKDKWKKREPLIKARAGHRMITMGQCLFAAGGYNSTSSHDPRCLQSVETYNLETKQWTNITPMKHGLAHFEMVVYNGKILVLGGVDSMGCLTQYMHEYDPELDRWKIFGELPRPLKNLSCCAMTVKLTDTGSGEDESDSILEKYSRVLDGPVSYCVDAEDLSGTEDSDDSDDFSFFIG